MTQGANDNEREGRQAAQGNCPVCGKPHDARYRPFCSKHCADVDLARWLGGRYAIPLREDEDEDGDTPRDADAGERG